MNKQEKLKIALPVLFVVMAFVWGPVITGSGSKQKKEKGTGSINSVTQEQGMDLTALAHSSGRKAATTSYAQWGRNPFSPAYDSSALILEGIVWEEENPKAIINGNIVSVGDHVGPNVISEIKQSSVVIKNGAEEIELRLGVNK